MKIIYSDRHRLHHGDKEMYRGQLVPCFEKPERADFVYQAVKQRQLGPILEPKEFPVAAIERVHAPRYVRFLEKAWTCGPPRATATALCPPCGRCAGSATTSSRRISQASWVCTPSTPARH